MTSHLEPWRPFGDLARFRADMDRLFGSTDNDWAMAVDVIDEDGRTVVRADLPGLKPEEVKVEVDDHVLTISGEHEEAEEEKTERFTRRERRRGSFSRSLRLPDDVDAGEITATSKDGVVEVVIPHHEKPAPKRVEVTT